MYDEPVAPVNHSTASALGTQAAGVAGGGLSGGAKAFLGGLKILALVGLGLGVFAGLLATGLITLPVIEAGSVAIPAIVGKLATVAAWALGGTAVGGALGVAAGWITIPVGGLVGMVKGGSKASRQVSNERAAAAELQAQVDIAKAQAMGASATTNVYAPSATNDNKYNFPEQGSAMNPALSSISAANDNSAYAAGESLENQGPVTGAPQRSQG